MKIKKEQISRNQNKRIKQEIKTINKHKFEHDQWIR